MIHRFSDESPMCRDMASRESAQGNVTVAQVEQRDAMTQRLLERDVNEIFEEMCIASDTSSSLPTGLAGQALPHRLPEILDENDNQELCLLGDEKDQSANRAMTSGRKTQNRLAKCIKNYLSSCRMNVILLMGSNSRRAANSRQARNKQKKSKEDKFNVPCLGRTRRWNIQKILGDIIKMEEEIVASVPRSILYYV